MDARDSTAANADLWNAYLRAEFSAWLDPFGLGRTADEVSRVLAEAAAAGIATAISAALAPPIARLYADNAPAVTTFVEAHRTTMLAAPAAAPIIDAAQPAFASDPSPTTDDGVVIPTEYARHHTGDSQIDAWTDSATHTVLAF